MHFFSRDISGPASKKKKKKKSSVLQDFYDRPIVKEINSESGDSQGSGDPRKVRREDEISCSMTVNEDVPHLPRKKRSICTSFLRRGSCGFHTAFPSKNHLIMKPEYHRYLIELKHPFFDRTGRRWGTNVSLTVILPPYILASGQHIWTLEVGRSFNDGLHSVNPRLYIFASEKYLKKLKGRLTLINSQMSNASDQEIAMKR